MPRIRIVCISDTHGQHAKLIVPDGDVLIHKDVIAGNHDLMFERHLGAARELLDNRIHLENSPTAYSAAPLSEFIVADSDTPSVRPFAKGQVRGSSFSPLH